MTALSPGRLADLAALLEERFGLHLSADALKSLRFAVACRFAEPDAPREAPDAWAAALRSPAGDAELRRLLPLVTVGKTRFFRDEKQFRALGALLPPLLARARAERRAAAIWSAGCASGEEPWSIAIAAAEAGARAGEVEIVATDVNPAAVAAAARGTFSEARLRDVPADVAARWFEREGGSCRARPALRALVRDVRAHNLASEPSPLPACGAWDVVFCRNVLIYFDAAAAKAVLARFLAALAPGGWLFLGAAESLFRRFDGFELTEVAGAFVYRRPGDVRA